MIFQISQVQIGQRINELRKRKQLSQEDLAKMVGISRPSLTQVELGKRSLNIMELQKFAQVVGFSLDDFMSQYFTPETINFLKKEKPKNIMERITVPSLQMENLKISYCIYWNDLQESPMLEKPLNKIKFNSSFFCFKR
ncbi:helix-turn-helix domain-containing protein [Flavobacterium sp. XS2P39]|uniref:helix-turn-helix domain-containing protein n=1 Tax=Flavobacterium sp. XS2P39 TaxID=3401725 RepID=UPI003AADA06A